MDVTMTIRIVQHPDKMDDDTFCAHMTHGHQESLGGLDEITPVHPGTTEAWRAFHDRLHALAHEELEHEHGPF